MPPLLLDGEDVKAMTALHSESYRQAISRGLIGMGIQCGIVGLPNVGKSTLFNALTQAGIDAENFPFCTIEPNTGVVPIPDPRQGKSLTS
ncbi:MAG: hypothetical protein CM15mP74_00300 [Halieaceae bacterium]|nr:MAG: hypothetical protein CM15mP74_00300 [Halieaceae bacterium]